VAPAVALESRGQCRNQDFGLNKEDIKLTDMEKKKKTKTKTKNKKK
jgi:hypothetical protein